jgi:hypothetical protein
MPDPGGQGHVGYLRIATEEAFAPRELLAAWREMLDTGSVDDPGFRSLWGFYLNSDSERATSLVRRLQDLGERRLADMDATGIDRQVISLTAPGTQIFDADRAVAMATLANDQLAEACRRHPGRFSGLTAIAPQAPGRALPEAQRLGHNQRHGLGPGDHVYPVGARRRPGPLRHGLPVSVRRRGGDRARRASAQSGRQEGTVPDECGARLQALTGRAGHPLPRSTTDWATGVVPVTLRVAWTASYTSCA